MTNRPRLLKGECVCELHGNLIIKWNLIQAWGGTAAAAAAKSLQSCPTPSNSMDCSLPVSSVHGIFQARVLEWVAIAFSNILA